MVTKLPKIPKLGISGMKLLFVNGSRGEWGYIQPIIDVCRERSIAYDICATNMVMLPGYGFLTRSLKKEGYNIDGEIYMSLEGHNQATMAKSLGVFLQSFVDTLARLQPTWVVVAGDRGEQLMAAIAAGYMYIPVAHIQAGELSGNIDGTARHAIGKFAHLHFAANADAADRLKKLGEEDFRIHLVGHPALDPIRKQAFTPWDQVSKCYGLPDENFFLVVLHPTTEDFERTEDQTDALIDAVHEFPQRKLWVLSNNDAGAFHLRQRLLERRTADAQLIENLPRMDYLGLMAKAQCVIGNSSSGLLEAPSFGTPAVNIGRRQHGRTQGANVINCPFEHKAITSAIAKALTSAFKEQARSSSNPYGDGTAAERILATLEQTKVDDRLLVKRLTY